MADLPIRGIFEEWEREETARREQSERLKSLFKRAKDDGYNPKALRVAFAEQYATDHFPAAKVAARTSDANDVDLYLAALAGVRTREGDEDLPDHDEETGEIIETQPSGNSGEFEPVQNLHEFTNPALLSSNSQAERQPESTEQSAGANAGEVVPPASSAPHEAEHGTVSSADFQREPASVPLVTDPLSDADAQRLTAGPHHPVGDHANSDGNAVASHASLRSGREEASRLAHNQEIAGSSPAPATSSLGSAADKSGEAGGVTPSASPAPTKLKMNAEFFDEPHPACQRGKFCGGNSKLGLCPECLAAASGVGRGEARVIN